MKIIQKLTKKREDNIYNTCFFLIKSLNLNFTKIGLSSKLANHLYYPSLLSIKDVLAQYGIESAAIRKGKHKYSDLETPYICSIQKENWSVPNFTIVTSADDNKIEYLDPSINSLNTISTSQFEQIDKNIILLLDSSTVKDEPDFIENNKKQKINSINKGLPFYLISTAILLSIWNIISKPSLFEYWYTIGYIITSSIGLGISFLLLWYDIDSKNLFIKEVCGGVSGAKVNCQTVLSSPKASFLGINWSELGFAFFATFLTTLLLFPNDLSFCFIWSCISLLACSYIIFSIYYQWKVLKEWCSLCLCVQAVLTLNGILAFSYLLNTNFSLSSLSLNNTTIILLFSIMFLYQVHTAIPIIKNANYSTNYKNKWEKLRFDPDIFQALLNKSDRVEIPNDDLGIIIGNLEARNEIIKVCNPYCGPCSKIHPELHKIVRSNANVRIRLIFTASGDEDDIRTAPVAHFLSIQEKLGHSGVHSALDDWYLAENKDYKEFAEKHPVNQEPTKQLAKIKAMNSWCNSMKIRVTPTIFINGKELPENYGVSDLKEFF